MGMNAKGHKKLGMLSIDFANYLNEKTLERTETR
jgi:hypothetical protein